MMLSQLLSKMLVIFLQKELLPVILLLSLQYLHVIRCNLDVDLINSPIFDNRPESKSLQDIQDNLDTLRDNVYNKKNALDPETQTKSDPERDKSETKNSNLKYIKKILSKFLSTLKRDKRKASGSMRAKGKPKWHKWTDWSTCSVTCGKGRAIRWRHCKANCEGVETEMEEMSCQLPECPRKLFGFLKL